MIIRYGPSPALPVSQVFGQLQRANHPNGRNMFVCVVNSEELTDLSDADRWNTNDSESPQGRVRPDLPHKRTIDG